MLLWLTMKMWQFRRNQTRKSLRMTALKHIVLQNTKLEEETFRAGLNILRINTCWYLRLPTSPRDLHHSYRYGTGYKTSRRPEAAGSLATYPSPSKNYPQHLCLGSWISFERHRSLSNKPKFYKNLQMCGAGQLTKNSFIKISWTS